MSAPAVISPGGICPGCTDCEASKNPESARSSTAETASTRRPCIETRRTKRGAVGERRIMAYSTSAAATDGPSPSRLQEDLSSAIASELTPAKPPTAATMGTVTARDKYSTANHSSSGG